jgi:integrase
VRYHEPFTLLPRKMPSGLTIWYYRARTEDGSRTVAWSTGQTTKSAARAHCRKLEKAGELIPRKDAGAPKPLTFGELARGFWTWQPPSPYIASRLRFSDPKKPAIAERYAHECSRIVELHLLPTFRRRHLDELTPQEIEAFALRLRDGGLSGKRVNNIVSCMRVILGEAYRAGSIPWDPASTTIRALGSATKHRGRLTREEVRLLFAEEQIEKAWRGHTLYRAISFVAAATGCRQGEILAVKDADFRDGFIHVAHSWNPTYGLGPTKTRQARDVPLPARVLEAVKPFLGSGGYVFSLTGGETPCTGNNATKWFYTALNLIGVKDREKRNVTFHSWRHWLNSTLRAHGVADDLTRRVTGHESEEMTALYTEYKPEDFAPVAAVQAEMFA